MTGTKYAVASPTFMLLDYLWKQWLKHILFQNCCVFLPLHLKDCDQSCLRLVERNTLRMTIVRADGQIQWIGILDWSWRLDDKGLVSRPIQWSKWWRTNIYLLQNIWKKTKRDVFGPDDMMTFWKHRKAANLKCVSRVSHRLPKPNTFKQGTLHQERS